MIKKENIKQLAELLHFTENNGNYFKAYNDADSIIIDIKNEEITWPNDLTVNDRTTSNFEHLENFVVLECVDRLLSRGYFARNMELEPRWQLGRGASGGKADILIKDNNGHEFLIIECKTYGNEFDKAWQKTLTDGDQLFSYAQQIKRTQYLCLYASDIENENVIYEDRIMTLKDNEDYLKTLKLSKRLRYKDASDVKELYKVWKDIYNLEYEETGIFEENIVPYEINKLYSIKDLKSIGFEDTQKKYNEFATILRQHNVSGHENAFDKLINIFLAKIVDEIEHPNNLKFNWRGIAFDDYYQLQDRLQKLYKDGMQKFLNEEVTYIDNKQLNDAFKLFKNDPDATKDKVMEYFRQLKFYTNNDFAFIDVHNESLFKQNSEVLLKMVKMFQDIKLKTEEQNQFLGDLFEGFLDDGIKQSEGQFFTPLPSTRFIVSSLPLKGIFENSDDYPYVIDYACGAGHFLNEYATQVKSYVGSEEELQNCFSHIDGIEKEYRLSKVSKVSAFMYGQDNINITYGDALANNKNIQDNKYSILIANPPYSVKGFLETLDEDERAKYELSDLVNPNAFSTNNSIETFFVERAKQLLKPNGVAGIILPSSLLTNNNCLYIKSREILIKYFDIISIVELPSGTFGATGTNTIILFLRRKDDNPSISNHLKNRVESWFNGNFEKDKVFEDKEILEEYLDMQNYDFKDYFDMINKKKISSNLLENDTIKLYLNDNKVKTVEKIIELEKEKLYYFLLTKNQSNDVLIINAPSKNENIKKYLGYEWSNRKGKEGIKYIGTNISDEGNLSKNQGIKEIKTPFFNPKDLMDDSKFNSIIRNNFNGKVCDISEIPECKYISLSDMINFSKVTFDKSLDLSSSQDREIQSDYSKSTINSLLKSIKGHVTKVDNNQVLKEGKVPVISQDRVNLINGYANTKKVINDLPLIVFGDHNCSIKYIDFNFVRGADGTQLLKFDSDKIITKYIYYLLSIVHIKNEDKYERHFKYLKDLKIPVPPKHIQKEVISECEKIDIEFKKVRMSFDDYKKKIENVFILKNIIKK